MARLPGPDARADTLGAVFGIPQSARRMARAIVILGDLPEHRTQTILTMSSAQRMFSRADYRQRVTALVRIAAKRKGGNVFTRRQEWACPKR